MKIIVAPNSFREIFPSELVSKLMIKGIRRAIPDATVIDLPLADGGDGTLSCMLRILGGNIYSIQARDPRGNLTNAQFAVTQDKRTAIIETADANGIRLVPVNERNPLHLSSCGVGDLLLAALNLNVENIYLGIGGSSTIDGGAGALATLGLKFLDSNGKLLLPTPYDLMRLHRIDSSSLDSRLQHVRLIALCDVHTPFGQCVSQYGKQKGVKPGDTGRIEQVLFRLASLAPKRSYDILEQPWLGAGGGLAGGLAAFTNADVVGGAEYLCGLSGVRNSLQDADILLTGEGRFDKGSFQGKLPVFIAMLAARNRVPAVIIAGQVVEENVETLPDLITLVRLANSSVSLQGIMEDLPLRLSSAAEESVLSAMKEIH